MHNKNTILIVEDNFSEKMLLNEFLLAEGFLPDLAENGKVALNKMSKKNYDLVISDLIMSGGIDGLKILEEALKKSNSPEFIITTGYGSIDNAVEAIKLGAFDYISKPLDFKKMRITIKLALERKNMKIHIEELQSRVDEKCKKERIIAFSKVMKEVIKKAEQVSKTSVTVLIEGKSGTGKEVIAQHIHKHSNRSMNPMVTINCASLPESLLESELFGHVKGAFTGAINNKIGLFEEAHKGTILLDEIGEMPLQLQSKLLRVLQNGEIRKVGSTKSKNIDVRVIACTNKDLKKMISKNTFREDLYYRLKVILISLPPLKDRKEEIIPLSNYFLSYYIKKFNKNIIGFSEETQKVLLDYNWPGNIRELENCIEAALALTKTDFIEPSDLFLESKDAISRENIDFSYHTKFFSNDHMNLKDLYDSVEKEFIINAFQENHSSLNTLASDMGVSRSTLWRKMDKYSIKYFADKNLKKE